MPTLRVDCSNTWEATGKWQASLYDDSEGSYELDDSDYRQEGTPVEFLNPKSKIDIPEIYTYDIKGDFGYVDIGLQGEVKAGLCKFRISDIPELQGAYVKPNSFALMLYCRDYDRTLFLSTPGGIQAYRCIGMHQELAFYDGSGNGEAAVRRKRVIEDSIGKYFQYKDDYTFMDPRYLNDTIPNVDATDSIVFGVRSGWVSKNLSPYFRNRIYGESFFVVDGVLGEFPPYLELSYELLTPTAQLTDVSEPLVLDASQNHTLTWEFGYEEHPDDSTSIRPYMVVNGYHQTSARFRIRPKGTTIFTDYRVEGSGNQVTIDSTQLTATEMEYQLIVTSNGGVSNSNEVWYPFTVQNPYITASNLSPRGQIINGDTANVFSWTTPGIGAGVATAYEAQISANNGATWTALASATQDVRRFTLAAKRLESGTYRWRVRCKNKANIWGPWSNAATVVVARELVAPVITSVTTLPRPTVQWTSQGQQAWWLQILDANENILYDSGEVYGQARKATAPIFLPDGAVYAAVRIANIFGVWSTWGVKSVVTHNKKGPAITIKTCKVPLGARVEWETTGKYIHYFIYRDGIPVARCIRSPYTDYRCSGKHTYFVRGVDAQGYYTDSSTVYEITRVDEAAIADYETLEWLRLSSRRGSMPSHETQREILVNFVHYDGRRLPVAEVSEFSDISHELSFTLYNRDDEEKLKKLLGKTVIYKNCYGDVIIGLLYKDSTSRNWAVDTTFSIVETDCREEINVD